MQPLGNVLQINSSTPSLKKTTESYLWETSLWYVLLQIKGYCSYCRTDIFQNSNFCRTSLIKYFCQIVTIQFLNQFLSVQYHSIHTVRLAINSRVLIGRHLIFWSYYLTPAISWVLIARHLIFWSCNLTPAVSWVLIGRHLIFCWPTWPTWCNSHRKCTPVKYKARRKAGFPTVT